MREAQRVTSNISPVSTETLSDRVYGRLARALMTGEFRPGASVTLREAAQLVGTSIMPVREALWTLTTQRAMILERNKAMHIPLLSDVEFDQLWNLRLLLESEACAQAAPVIQAGEVTALARLVRDAVAAVQSNDLRPVIIKSHEFFFRIYRSTGNSMLVSIIEMLWLRTGPLYFDTLSPSSASFTRKSLRHNTLLLEALRSGDAHAARTTRENDLRELAAWLRDHREREQLSGSLPLQTSVPHRAAAKRKRRSANL